MKQNIKKNRLFKIIILGQLFATLLLVGLYIFQTGDLTALSQNRKTNELALEKIKAENLALQTAYLEKLSLKNIDEKLRALDFVAVKEVKYLPMPATILAAQTNNQ